MKVALDYGREGVEAEVPDDAKILSMAPMPGLDRVEERLYESLRRPSGTAPLIDLARGRSDACVVISDITRPVPNSTILPPILATLENAGIARDAVTILIATGLHRPNEGEELVELVGPRLRRNTASRTTGQGTVGAWPTAETPRRGPRSGWIAFTSKPI